MSDAVAEQPKRTPNVLVILVTKDGVDRLRTCLAALARQSYARIGVLAVDNASTDGSAELLASSLGEDHVIRLPENLGFPGAISEALRSDTAAHADHVLLMHDDTLLAPEAIEALVEASERMPGVGIVGPKVLDAEDPTILREIGMSVDLFGHPYSPLERGEIDQGQYDRLREVFYVSSCAMLVSSAVIERVGPPDERLSSNLDEMDYCWRARIAGFRVLWTPTAVALHPGGRRGRSQRAGKGTVFQRERGAVASMLKDYSLLSLLWILPLAVGQMLVRVVYHLLSRRFEDAYQILAAWGWNVAHLAGTGRRRSWAQKARTVPDRQVRQFTAPVWIRLNRWGRTVMEARRSTAADRSPDAERPTTWSRIGSLSSAHPVGVAWLVGAVVAFIAYRHLITASPLSGGSLAAFPSAPGGFFTEFVSGLRHTALGGTAPASPSLPMLGVSSVLAFANPPLLQKILILVLPIIAAAACYRALRALPVEPIAAVLGACCYALSSLTLWAVSEGRLPELVFLAGLPWLVGRLISFFGSRAPVRRIRWVVGAALGLAALGSFFPGAFLAAILTVIVAAILPGGGGRLAGVARAAVAVLGAAVLAWPIASGIIGSSGRSLADAVGPRSFGQVLRVALGPAPGDWGIGYFLPIAAALGLGFASGRLRRPAARSLLMALAGVYLAWAAGAGWLPNWLSNPVAFGGVAAFAMASLAAMGLDSVLAGLQDRSFGIAQVGSAALIAVVALGLAGQSVQAMRGGWTIGGGDRVSPAYAVVRPGSVAPYRVLWIGKRLGGRFPAPGGGPMGVAPAGQASLRFAVTAPAGASAYDFGRPLDGTGFTQLADTLSTIMADPTRHAGAMLAPFGIGYVVAGTADLPPGAAARLNQQLDLVGTEAAGLSIFRDEVTVPLASLVADPAWRVAAASHDPAAAAMLRTPDAIPLSGSDGSYVGGPLGSRKIPPGSMVLLSQQFDRHWVLSERPNPVALRVRDGGGTVVAPRPAFGWAIGFAHAPAPFGFTVRFTGQSTRTAEVVLLALLWTAALWITRRRSRAD